VKDYEQKVALANDALSKINTPTKRNISIPAKVTELSRETVAITVVITYKVVMMV
jgi:hypothetical protein